MNKRLTITLTLFLIILSSTVVSAGLFDGIDSSSDVKTHEFNLC